MSMEKASTRALWGSRVIVIAGLLGMILVGIGSAAWAAAQLSVQPTSGPAGTRITIQGSGFAPPQPCNFGVSFTDASGGGTGLGSPKVNSQGTFKLDAQIPSNAAVGAGSISATQYVYFYQEHRCVFGPSASATFTVTGTQQLLRNPGFENGSSNPAPWVTTARINDTAAEPPHSGSWDAWLGGTGTTHTDRLYQQVGLPTGISSATLAFFLHIDSADTGSTAHDRMALQVRDSSNALLATLAVYSNLNSVPGYAQRSFDLTSYAGQTIRVFLASREDASLQTSFVVDDFALTVTAA